MKTGDAGKNIDHVHPGHERREKEWSSQLMPLAAPPSISQGVAISHPEIRR